MKDTQQWVTERSPVPGLSFMMDRFQTLDLAEFIRRDRTHSDLLTNPSVSFICGGKTFNKLFEDLGE